MTDQNIEKTILRNIINNEKFMRRVLPFMKTAYFEGPYRVIFRQIGKYVTQYNRLPTSEALKIEFDLNDSVQGDMYSLVVETIPDLYVTAPVDEEWLLDNTEKWCQTRALHNAIFESISILDGKHDKLTKTAIPQLLTDALAISFDPHIGHDYLEDMESRFDFYHTEHDRIPFDLNYFNIITSGGLIPKTLTIFLAGTGVGKSLFMCHMAASSLLMGKNVLYITCEMSEEKIAQRIDANLLDIPIAEIEKVSRDTFKDRISQLKTKTAGKLIIKEYPTGQANVSHFRALLNDLKLKKQFKPDIIFVDYLNICASSRLRGMGGGVNSYSYIKAIAEELRGLGVEFNVPIVSATQTTRSGYTNSDPGLEDTSESFGLPATADLMVALVTNEELERDGQILVKQLKNRYNDPNYYKRFIIGVNKRHMRLFDVEDIVQSEIAKEEDIPTVKEVLRNPDKLLDAKEFIF